MFKENKKKDNHFNESDFNLYFNLLIFYDRFYFSIYYFVKWANILKIKCIL